MSPAKIAVQDEIDYLETLADGSVSLVLSDVSLSPLTFMIFDADGALLRSMTKPSGDYSSAYSLLALRNGNFVFVYKTEIKTIVFEIYDHFLNLIKGATTVKFSDLSANDISNEMFDPTVFKLNSNGFGIIYQRDESTQYINFYDQDGNFLSNSPETFPASGFHRTRTQALQMPDNNILYLYQESVQTYKYFKSLKSNNAELCTPDFLDCCDHQLNYVKSKVMKNGLVLIAWLREDYSLAESEAYFTIFDGSCLKTIFEAKIGNTYWDPRIECLENGDCVAIYLKMVEPNSVYEIVLRVFASATNTFGDEIIVAKTASMDIMISGYSNSNFMMVWTDIFLNQIVGRVYSTDCLEYVGEECQSCSNSKVFSKGGKACVTPIEGCIEYSADGKCTCNSPNILTVDGICAPSIFGCSAYSSDGKCETCLDSKILTSDRTACLTEIESCLTYANDGKCLSCVATRMVIRENTACGPVITGCVLYSTNGQICLSCEYPKNPIQDGLACRSGIIIDCTSYSNDGSCLACSSTKVLSADKTNCVEPIQDCLEYKDKDKCLACGNKKILSSNKKECFAAIAGCIKYGSDSKCKFCIPGTKLSSDKLSCVVI